ncbi:MAG: YbaB/EbfC family nucleoid-associated protein [Phycisphaerales bacterium]|nr:YbaB/EbfC family nucleoid-associated protein [Phycisphaerales bacterium]MCI0630334.1 YbaB/EbfC family nucleoid-associated protein [Phycisphaerales bacterium]MCI0676218.1 YbaB/EbfC family nucleoid-associated protein [Phycisphaerales bacterium]
MFETIKGMAGMANLMKDLPKLKARMEKMKEDLGRISVQAETGGGAVRVTANGQLRITALHVDQAMIAALVEGSNPDDQAMAEDLIVGAVNAALEKARQRAEQELAGAAQEMNLPISPDSVGALLR